MSVLEHSQRVAVALTTEMLMQCAWRWTIILSIQHIPRSLMPHSEILEKSITTPVCDVASLTASAVGLLNCSADKHLDESNSELSGTPAEWFSISMARIRP